MVGEYLHIRFTQNVDIIFQVTPTYEGRSTLLEYITKQDLKTRMGLLASGWVSRREAFVLQKAKNTSG